MRSITTAPACGLTSMFAIALVVSDQTHLSTCRLICTGHAIRKAASELSKKQSGVEKHQSAQKRRSKKFKDDNALPTSPSIQIPFHPSMNYDLMSNIDHLASIGADLRVDRTNASFLGPLDSALPSSSASPALHNSLNAAASDISNNYASYLPYAQADILTGRRDFSGEAAAAAAVARQCDWGMLYGNASGGVQSGLMGLDGSDNPALLQSVHRRQLLLGAAKKQQEAMAMLRQSSEMTRLAQTPGAEQVQIPASAMGGYGAFGDIARQERTAVFAAAGPQNIGSRMGLSSSVTSTFDPQAMRASHLASATTPLGSFLTPSSSTQLQLARVTDSEHGFLRSPDFTGDSLGREQ